MSYSIHLQDIQRMLTSLSRERRHTALSNTYAKWRSFNGVAENGKLDYVSLFPNVLE